MSEVDKGPRHLSGVTRYALTLTAVWTLAVGGSLTWNWLHEMAGARQSAGVASRAAFRKDVIYRRWNSSHGGVYAPISESTQPNPFLTHVEEREIETPSGRRLTLINPAYMTRQVHELGWETEGVRGHITSLNPIRPANAPDAWEERALESFEQGQTEFVSFETFDGEEHLRLMRPLMTEKGCLKCHAEQGYREGDVRGGISVSMPMAPYLAIARNQTVVLGFAHGGLWVLGLVGIGVATRSLRRREQERDRAETARDETIGRLQAALEEVKTLRGIVPICSHCKKIRDDRGFWNQVEVYVHEHSEAEFSHGICPECIRELYPEEADRVLGSAERRDVEDRGEGQEHE